MKNAIGSDPAPGTVGDALAWAARRLRAGGVRAPRREAAALWTRVLNADAAAAVSGADDALPEPERERFQRAVERRACGVPLAYATGWAGFRTLDLQVDARVLIPRPETEGLVQLVLDWAVERGVRGAVADVGTGSGCVALSLAAEGAFSRIVATDASPEAVAVARANVARIAPATPVEVRQGDLLAPLAGETFHALVSNPPYLTAAEFDASDESVRLHEPRAALVSREEGLYHTRLLLEEGMAFVAPEGLLALELDAVRADRVLGLALEAGWEARVEADLFGRPRYLVARAPGGPGPGPGLGVPS